MSGLFVGCSPTETETKQKKEIGQASPSSSTPQSEGKQSAPPSRTQVVSFSVEGKPTIKDGVEVPYTYDVTVPVTFAISTTLADEVILYWSPGGGDRLEIARLDTSKARVDGYEQHFEYTWTPGEKYGTRVWAEARSGDGSISTSRTLRLRYDLVAEP